MRVSAREKRVLVVGGVAALAILVGVYVVEPFLTSQAATRDEIAAARRTVERGGALAAERERQQRQIEALRGRLRAEETLLFAGERLPVVAAEIQGLLHTLGQETGITILRENVPQPRKADTYTQVTVELSVRGELRAIRDFLYRVQTAPKLLSVPRLAIRGTTSRTQTALTADLQVSGYTLAADEKPASPAPAKGPARGAGRG
ncbi:MAG: type II secretion system protein GspM [Candidatus Methylomirabilales bacterium]